MATSIFPFFFNYKGDGFGEGERGVAEGGGECALPETHQLG